jgi:hypothetical protein
MFHYRERQFNVDILFPREGKQHSLGGVNGDISEFVVATICRQDLDTYSCAFRLVGYAGVATVGTSSVMRFFIYA